MIVVMASNQDRRYADRAAGLVTAILLVCLGILGFALYLQHVLDLDPCPWCVVQRLAFIVIALVCVIAIMIRPSGGGITFTSLAIGLIAAGGIAAASYHIYIQSDPARAQSCAGSVVERLLDASKLGKWVPPLLQYDGACTLKPWSLLGLSIPEWSLAWFVVLLAAAIAMPFAARR